MKKRFYVFSMLAAGMLFAGCSDDLEGGQDGPNVVEGVTGYVRIALNLPTAPASNFRADVNNNDDFEDGIEAEYKVNDVILALFYGTDETSATLGCAYGLSGTWTDDLDDDNVTRYISSVQEIKAPADKQKVYALVIVNGKKSGYFNVSSSNMLQFSANSSSPSDVGSDFKLASFYNVAMNNVDLTKIANTGTSDGEVNFLMLNAPTSNKQAAASMNTGSDHSVTTLVEVDVWESEAAAESNDANEIYVERAVAKVTVSVNNSTKDDYSLTVEADGTTYDGATVTFEGWKLQTTNKSMFAVRNVYASDASTMMPDASPAWKTWASLYVDNEICRFFGSAAAPYRVYWGVDPNYFSVVDENNIATNFNVYSGEDNLTWNRMNNTSTTNWVAEYCAENTTIAKAMQDDNLTGVLLKAKFELDESGDNSGINDDLFMINNTSAIYTDEQFIAVATAALTGNDALTGEQTLTLKTVGGMTITSAENVSDLLQISGGTSSELSSEQEKAILDACGGSIKYYKDGVMYYYTSLIQHFGDVPTKVDGPINDVKDYDEEKHLGRYGVLRNNWYELNITRVGGPGEPEIPEVPEEPADATEGYINVAINVLSWAKRQQNVDL